MADMHPLLKAIRQPRKLFFYAFIKAASLWPRRHRAVVSMRGAGHTRPNLTWKLFRLNGIVETSKADAPVSYYHQDATTVAGDLRGSINGACRDIGKQHVATVFAGVAGYDLAVDPRRHHGKMVQKSETNALHDGVILLGPIDMPKPGYVYQRLIDNRDGPDTVLDIRPCVIGTEIPFCYLKWRPVASRFSNDNSKVTHCPATEVLSAAEIDLILLFCRKIGLDVGELDVLRDQRDGRIYIVDAAKTPHSPSDSYLGLGGIAAMQLAAKAFRRQFLNIPLP